LIFPVLIATGRPALEFLSEGGPVLGIFPEALYTERQVRFGSGDRLILYTDGITGAPAFGESGTGATLDAEPAIDDFGGKRLVRLAVANRTKSAADLQALVVDAAKAHSGGTFHDDATLIVVATG